MDRLERQIVRLSIAIALLIPVPGSAKDFVAPDQIVYDRVPGFGAQGGTRIFEWDEISASTPGETPVKKSLDAPKGLKLRWLGTAGFEISDDNDAILLDPFVSRPAVLQTVSLNPLNIDTEAVDKYVIDPMMRSGAFRNLRAILVSHTHHDHAEDVPYILSKFRSAKDRPMVVGDPNLACLLRAYDGREQEITWVAGVDPLHATEKIDDFDDAKKLRPAPGQKLGFPVGRWGKFTVTAFISEHGFYDDIPLLLEGDLSGPAPLAAVNYKAYLNSSLTWLIEYAGDSPSQKPFKIFASDSARFLLPDLVSPEVTATGPVDLLLEGIAARAVDNRIPLRIEKFMPEYFVPTHYDNFFVPLDQFQTFDFELKAPTDNSKLKDFIDKEFCGLQPSSACPRFRMMKMFYYYSLETLRNTVRPAVTVTPTTLKIPCSAFRLPLGTDGGNFHKIVNQFINTPERRTLDNFRSVPEATGCTVSAGEKFRLFLTDTLAPTTFALPALKAGYGQFQNTDPSFGQSAAGYFHRYGAALADSADSSFLKLFLYPTLTFEDPWYHRISNQTSGERLTHSLTHVLLTDTSNGRRRPNLSEWLGAASAAAITNLYRPDNPRGFSATAKATLISVGTDAGNDVLREFWPSVRPVVCSVLHLACPCGPYFGSN
jgi:hypothetical protein